MIGWNDACDNTATSVPDLYCNVASDNNTTITTAIRVARGYGTTTQTYATDHPNGFKMMLFSGDGTVSPWSCFTFNSIKVEWTCNGNVQNLVNLAGHTPVQNYIFASHATNKGTITAERYVYYPDPVTVSYCPVACAMWD